jgi:hypothetical protein
VMFSATGSWDIADFLDYGRKSDMVKPIEGFRRQSVQNRMAGGRGWIHR